jgi:hypothetical protein
LSVWLGLASAGFMFVDVDVVDADGLDKLFEYIELAFK